MKVIYVVFIFMFVKKVKSMIYDIIQQVLFKKKKKLLLEP